MHKLFNLKKLEQNDELILFSYFNKYKKRYETKALTVLNENFYKDKDLVFPIKNIQGKINLIIRKKKVIAERKNRYKDLFEIIDNHEVKNYEYQKEKANQRKHKKGVHNE
jgi:hypothetical protein